MNCIWNIVYRRVHWVQYDNAFVNLVHTDHAHQTEPCICLSHQIFLMAHKPLHCSHYYNKKQHNNLHWKNWIIFIFDLGIHLFPSWSFILLYLHQEEPNYKLIWLEENHFLRAHREPKSELKLKIQPKTEDWVPFCFTFFCALKICDICIRNDFKSSITTWKVLKKFFKSFRWFMAIIHFSEIVMS